MAEPVHDPRPACTGCGETTDDRCGFCSALLCSDCAVEIGGLYNICDDCPDAVATL